MVTQSAYACSNGKQGESYGVMEQCQELIPNGRSLIHDPATIQVIKQLSTPLIAISVCVDMSQHNQCCLYQAQTLAPEKFASPNRLAQFVLLKVQRECLLLQRTGFVRLAITHAINLTLMLQTFWGEPVLAPGRAGTDHTSIVVACTYSLERHTGIKLGLS